MATAVIGALRVNLSADSAQFSRALTNAEKRAEAFGRKIGSSMKVLAGLGSAATAAGAAIAVSLTKRSLETIDATSKMARQIGLATESLMGLRFAAREFSGTADGQLDMALRRMTRRISEAAQGAGPATNALKALGLSAAELARMSPDEQFKAIADGMREIGTQGERLQATMAIFDTEGMPLVNTLTRGAAAIEEMERRAKILGLTVSSIDAFKIEQANSAMSRVWKLSEGIGNELAVRLAPIIEYVATWLENAALEAGGFGNAIDKAVSMGIRLFAAIQREVYLFRVGLDDAIADVLNFRNAVGEALSRGLNAISGGLAEATFTPIEHAFGRLRETLEKPPSSEEWEAWLEEIRAKMDAAAAEGLASLTGGGGEGGFGDQAAIAAAEKLQEQLAARLEAFRAALMTEREAEMASFAQRIIDLNDFLDAGLISRREYHDLSLAAERKHAEEIAKIDKGMVREAARTAAMRRQALFGMIGDLTGAMDALFGESKASAYANALVSTAEAVTRALANPPGPPFSYGQAAAAAAAGAAQLAAINRTSRKSKGSVPSVGGGRSAAAAPAAAPAEAGGGQQGPGVTLFVSGINPGQLYTGEAMRGLFDAINGHIKDGGRLVLA